jgi:iron complex outermembrane receptor protein
VGPASALTACTDLTGRRISNAPTWTANLGAQYEFDVGDGATLTPRIDYGYVGSQWATLFQNVSQNDQLSARNIVNAQLTYGLDTWKIAAYSTNLNDLHYVSQNNSGLRFPGAPRQFGIRISKSF